MKKVQRDQATMNGVLQVQHFECDSHPGGVRFGGGGGRLGLQVIRRHSPVRELQSCSRSCQLLSFFPFWGLCQ